jgi:hypothetical protein
MEARTKKNGLLLHTVGKEVKYVTKLHKGTDIKKTYKTSKTTVKSLA